MSSRLIGGLRGVVFLSAAVVGQAGATAPDNVQKWLEGMANAVRMLNYEGELIYHYGRQLEVLSLTHTVQDGFERERITSLNGSPREIVRDDDSVVCIQSGSKSVDQRPGGQGFPSLLPLAVDELGDSYEMKLSGTDRIADQKVQIIDVMPRDGYRYGHRIYVQVDTLLPLRLDMLDREGRSVAQIMFSRIKVGNDIPHELSSPSLQVGEHPPVKRKIQRRDERLTSPFAWSFMQLPKGFQINARQVKKDKQTNSLQEHVVLTDGLATVSVYIEEADKVNGLEGASKMGAVSAYGRRLEGLQITAVGEVPGDTVRFMAEAVETQQ